MIKLNQDAIEVIENILNDKGIAEVKNERDKVVIVRQTRQVKYPIKENK